MIILSLLYVFAPAIIVIREGQTHVEALWMSIVAMLALAVTLFFQARRSKLDPTKAEY